MGLTCDGVKNKYVWLDPWTTLCNGFTCECPSNRKWADSKFEHGLFATWNDRKKKRCWLNRLEVLMVGQELGPTHEIPILNNLP